MAGANAKSKMTGIVPFYSNCYSRDEPAPHATSMLPMKCHVTLVMTNATIATGALCYW